jgi:hypothetical protein
MYRIKKLKAAKVQRAVEPHRERKRVRTLRAERVPAALHIFPVTEKYFCYTAPTSGEYQCWYTTGIQSRNPIYLLLFLSRNIKTLRANEESNTNTFTTVFVIYFFLRELGQCNHPED